MFQIEEFNCQPFLNVGMTFPQENKLFGVTKAGIQNCFGFGEKLEFELVRNVASSYQVIGHKMVFII